MKALDRRAAECADENYVDQLNLAGIPSRWHHAGSGSPGTALRKAYDAKVAADRAMSDAFEADRKATQHDIQDRLRDEISNTGDC
jgi:hypothetical protein